MALILRLLLLLTMILSVSVCQRREPQRLGPYYSRATNIRRAQQQQRSKNSAIAYQRYIRRADGEAAAGSPRPLQFDQPGGGNSPPRAINPPNRNRNINNGNNAINFAGGISVGIDGEVGGHPGVGGPSPTGGPNGGLGDRSSGGGGPPATGGGDRPVPGGSRKEYRTMAPPRCSNGSHALPCETDSEYNQDVVERVREILQSTELNGIMEDGLVRQLLNDSYIVRDKTLHPGEGINTRSGFVTETPACRAQESIIYPQRAKSTSDDWVFVLNQDSVKQGVRVEKCIREGESCHLGTGIPPTLRTTCRQKFIYRKLLVLSGTGSTIQPESVLIPSCCVCYISKFDVPEEPSSIPEIFFHKIRNMKIPFFSSSDD